MGFSWLVVNECGLFSAWWFMGDGDGYALASLCDANVVGGGLN